MSSSAFDFLIYSQTIEMAQTISKRW